MKVLFDHQIFTSQIYGGISRYFFELMSNFNNDKEIEYLLSLKYSNNYYLKNLNGLSNKTFLEHSSFRGKYRFLNLINKKVSKDYLLRENYDIFHPTYYDTYFIKFNRKKPFVLTILDMIHETFPDNFAKNDKTTERKKILAQMATKIIAISKNTKKDIVNILGIDERKIEVIYLANSLKLNNGVEKLNVEIPEKYILFVGSRRGYKNFELFIKAVSPLLKDISNLNIVCAGGGDFSKIEIEKFRSLKIRDKLFYYSGSDSILACLYQKAIAFVFPSLYEGFGIPVLESFACKCPVIVSNTSSFPEVAGDAAIYFNPTDKLSILNSIQKVVYNEELRKKLICKGFQRVKKFTWRETAQKTKRIYESIF